MIPGSLNAPILSNVPVAGFVGLLDQYPGAAAAYSTRTLRAPQTVCLRVRRSSDNTEQDIGFSAVADGNGNYFLDETSLLAFVGAASGFVTAWYDESGFGLNATQATAAQQPRIVAAGVIERTPSSAVALNFLGNSFLTINAGTGILRNVNYAGAFAVYQNLTASGQILFSASSGLSSSLRFDLSKSATGGRSQARARRLDTDAATIEQSGDAISTYNHYLAEGRYATGELEAYLNGVSNGPTALVGGSGSTSNSNSFVIPAIGTSTVSDAFANGRLAELVVYTNTSAITNRAAIIANQMAAFGVTP